MLSRIEIEHFKENGFVILPDVIPPEDILYANQKLWELLPPSFESGKPDTWLGEVSDCCETKDLGKRRGRIKYRNCVWDNKRIYAMLALNPKIREAVGQLIGDFAEPERVRGLYPTFPVKDPKGDAYPGHEDKHVFQVGMIGYLSDVGPKSGATTAYPGSHKILYYAHEKELEWSPKPDVHEREIATLLEQKPIELTAKAGSVILWHHRLFHGVSYNQSNQIREAILGDFCCANKEDTAQQPTQQDMWNCWRI